MMWCGHFFVDASRPQEQPLSGGCGMKGDAGAMFGRGTDEAKVGTNLKRVTETEEHRKHVLAFAIKCVCTLFVRISYCGCIFQSLFH